MAQYDLETRLESELHVSRYIIAYKLILGLVEITLALGIIFAHHHGLAVYRNFVSQELLEDPHDLIFSFTQLIIPYLLDHQTSIIIYLIALGSIKVAGAIGLIYHQHWGVDLLLGLTLILFPFQFYNLIFRHSLADLFYIVTGIIIALFLVNFKPQHYAHKLVRRYKKTQSISDNIKLVQKVPK